VAPVKGLQMAWIKILDVDSCLKISDFGGRGNRNPESDMLLREVKNKV
jgi:hypothetical protein